MWRKWSRWGVFDFTAHAKPQPICYSVAFDPDGLKRVSNDMVAEAKIDLRLHSWFAKTIVEDGRAAGVIVESKEGRQALLGQIVDRRDRRSRCRGLRRCPVFRRQLYRHHRVPPGRGRH